MNQYSYFKYTLHSVTLPNARTAVHTRQGALVRVTLPGGQVGYADYHPWPEFGDAGIETKKIAERLLQQSLKLAEQDALLRSQGLNAFENQAQVRNHFLIRDLISFDLGKLDEIKTQGFRVLKLKVGKDLAAEAASINQIAEQSSLSLRLDFNSSLDGLESFKKFAAILSAKSRGRIEFVEDPFPFDFEKWTEAQNLLSLAADFEFERMKLLSGRRPPYSFLIAKPARQDIEQSLGFCRENNLKMVVTSSMDHPVGVAHSLRAANWVWQKAPDILNDCGCLTFDQYELPDFTSQIGLEGPSLSYIRGTGIGFDQALAALDWRPTLFVEKVQQ